MYRKSLIAVVLVLVFLLSGTTITAFAAQGSLPGDALYGVKAKLEDLQINTARDTANEVEKSIQYADRRIQEIAELVNRSRQADIQIGVERFEYHLREALSALEAIAKNDPDRAQELALTLTDLLEEHSNLIAALLESDSGVNVLALSEALTATYLSIDTVGSIAGITEGEVINNFNNDAGMNDDIISNDDGEASDDDDYGYDDSDDDASDDDEYGYGDDDDDVSDDDDDYGYGDDDDNASGDDNASNDDDDYGYHDDDDDASNDDDDYGYHDDDDDAMDDDDDGYLGDDDDASDDNDDDNAIDDDDDDGNDHDDDSASDDDDDGHNNDDDGHHNNDDGDDDDHHNDDDHDKHKD